VVVPLETLEDVDTTPEGTKEEVFGGRCGRPTPGGIGCEEIRGADGG